MIVQTTKYTKAHEWISVEGDIGTVGITDQAQRQLGDGVFVEVPDVGRNVSAGEACAVVESVKAASDIYAPVAGVITDNNGELTTTPAMVNESAEGRAWFFKIRLSSVTELEDLMSRVEYEAYCETGV